MTARLTARRIARRPLAACAALALALTVGPPGVAGRTDDAADPVRPASPRAPAAIADRCQAVARIGAMLMERRQAGEDAAVAADWAAGYVAARGEHMARTLAAAAYAEPAHDAEALRDWLVDDFAERVFARCARGDILLPR